MQVSPLQHALPNASDAFALPDGIQVADEPFILRDLEHISRMLGQQADSGMGKTSVKPDMVDRGSFSGAREYLGENEGTGYWDCIRLSDDFMVSVTEAVYKTHCTMLLDDGAPHLKVRLLLSGHLLAPDRSSLVEGPQAYVHLQMARGVEHYVIEGGQRLKMVVLHCRKDFLRNLLGLNPEDTPPPFNRLFGKEYASFSRNFFLTPKLARAAQMIIDARFEFPRPLRGRYIEAVGTEILCEILADHMHRDMKDRSGSRLSARDMNRIFEARDYLADHFVQPPRVGDLARVVGLNQTKLKSGFKELVGTTIYGFVLQKRMERAAELLLEGKISVSEIAYEVGYNYPANFSSAFKHYHGTLPRLWSTSAART